MQVKQETDVKVLNEEDKLEIVTQCPMCGEHHQIYVNLEDWHEYKYHTTRRHIQEIFPYLSNAEREMLMTGICPKCFDEMFAEDDEEETPEDDDWKTSRERRTC